MVIVRDPATGGCWPWPDPTLVDWLRSHELDKVVDKKTELAIKVVEMEQAVAVMKTQQQLQDHSVKAGEKILNIMQEVTLNPQPMPPKPEREPKRG